MPQVESFHSYLRLVYWINLAGNDQYLVLKPLKPNKGMPVHLEVGEDAEDET
jgi:hypothetical protein